MRGRVGVALIAALLVGACTEIYLPGPTSPSDGSPVFILTNNQNSQNVGALPDGAALPGGAGPIVRVKVGFYGGTCPSGPMQAGQTELQVNCTGDMTATPKVKLPDGGGERDATEVEHGSPDDVTWMADIGADVLVCVTSPANGFNRMCAAKKAGKWRQCATVKNVRGCAEGNVT